MNRCKHPNVTDADGKVLAKRNLSWSIVEDEASLGNSRSLNAILNGVDHNVFKLVNACTSAKEALGNYESCI